MSQGKLHGRVAMVTGGGAGFGRAISERFAKEGASVVIGDVNEKAANETASRIGGDKSHVVLWDVTNTEHWKSAVNETVKKFGRIDIVINNAGTTYKNKPTKDVTEAEFDRVFNVNVKSIFQCVKAVVPKLQEQGQGGCVISISSIGSVRPRPGLTWYNSTKAAVTNATLALAAEYGGDGIRFNALAPLLSGTALFESFVGVPYSEENIKQFVAQVPLGRLTDPTDVASAATFLASDDAKFITGVNLLIDGGKGI